MGQSFPVRPPDRTMSQQLYMERSRDCVVPDKTFWAPIPIQRVTKEDDSEESREEGRCVKIHCVAAENKENEEKLEDKTNKEASATEGLKVLNYTSLFPRKRRTDLYPEIESRKFLDKKH